MPRWAFADWCRARRTYHALPPSVRARLRRLRASFITRPGLDQPLALARIVALDLETTGPRMAIDRIISMGAVAVTAGTVRHDDCYEALLRQDRSSDVDNILVHRIGGQQQLGGCDPVEALVGCLEHIGSSRVVAFRAEFDETVLRREVSERLGLRAWPRFIDLAALLPALFPGTSNDSLDDWVRHFGLVPPERHQAVTDAYATAQLLTIVLAVAPRSGLRTLRDLTDAAQAQHWLGRRR